MATPKAVSDRNSIRGARLTRRGSPTDGSVAALPLPPAAERQYRYVIQ